MESVNPKIEESWKLALANAFNSASFHALKSFLAKEKQAGKHIYPNGSSIFKAFNTCPFDEVRVVILGQDPYHGPNQAHGLSFSVPDGVSHPPSLQNIFKEINRSLKQPCLPSGDLSRWATQGVLLLNAILTVEAGKAGSHRNQGWEEFTDEVLIQLNQKRKGIVYMLWGNYARSKARLLNRENNLVLESVHPSPLSAYQGFIGNNHFVLANEYLIKHEQQPIDWK